MLAPRTLSANFKKWNHIYGAPFGHKLRIPRRIGNLLPSSIMQRMRGPFAFQGNSTQRHFEYPWAFQTAELKPGMNVIEIGGSLSGFQFVLDSFGCHVINIDPGMESLGWPCNQESIQKLNRLFDAQVDLRNTTIDQASISDESIDRAFSISVIEHLSPEVARMTMKHIHRSLKLGGLLILTIDLFLNLDPFCSRSQNEFGCNQDVRTLIDDADWELVVGDRHLLNGFPEFDRDFILSHLEDYLLAAYPALTQCLVLRKH